MSARYETEDDEMLEERGTTSRSTPIDADSIELAVAAAPSNEQDSLAGGNRFSDSLMGVTRPFQRAYVGKSDSIDELESAPTGPHRTPDPLPPSPRQSSDEWFKPSLKTESMPDLSGLANDSSVRTFERSLGLGVDADSSSRTPLFDLHARPWLFSALLGATCLVVGMVLGALMVGGQSSSPDDKMTIIKCSEPPAN